MMAIIYPLVKLGLTDVKKHIGGGGQWPSHNPLLQQPCQNPCVGIKVRGEMREATPSFTVAHRRSVGSSYHILGDRRH